MHRFYAILGMALIALFAVQHVPAQESMRQQLFAEAEKAKQQASEKNARVLAPRSYAKAMDYYEKAKRDFQRGKELESIRKNLSGANAYFKKAIEATRLAEVTFSSVMASRNDAMSADAKRFSQELWKQAELKFVEAAGELEKGDVNDAKKKGKEAEVIYRQAELEAIKANFLTPAWSLLEKADREKVKNYAPQTLAKARELAKRAEDLLRQNRYDNDEARQLAQEAKYEAAHALYLKTAIERVQESELDFEDVFLIAERPLQKIAGTLEISARFDKGFEPVTDKIVNQVEDYQEKLRLALEVIEKRNEEITTLKEQIASMESRLGSLSEAEIALKQKLEQRRRQEERVQDLLRLFTRAEAQILRDRNNIIIRLYGLSFPVGSAVIESQFFRLLTKVQAALSKFPNRKVIIEGHTDSQGSDAQNQRLSEQRAAAVRQYLLANMSIPPDHISSVGYGESRPLASNETPQGRARNRRIEIVIIPEWATDGNQ